MAKRYTDSEKWKRPWYRDMPPQMRELWNYILDNCDHAGVWTVDLKGAAFALGYPISPADYAAHLGPKLVRLDNDKVFIPSFIEFQYGELSEESRPHKAVIKTLNRYRIDPKTLTLLEGYPKGIDTLKDKEQEKEQEQAQEREGGVGETKAVAPALSQTTPELRAEIDDAVETYRETLRKFNMGRTVLDTERLALGRGIQQYGLSSVKFALKGMAQQKSSPGWDASQFVSLHYLFNPKNFMRLLNLGVQAEHKNPKGGAA